MKKRRASGFTLIEILVVIVIIGILTSLAVVGVSAALETARKNATETLLQQLGAQCEAYKSGRWGDYPPSTLADLKITVPNDTNNGIEALVACLASTLKGGHLLGTIKDEQYCNLDNDVIGSNPNKWFFGDNKLREIMDSWGNAVTYVHNKDYKMAPISVRKYIFSEGATDAVFEIEKSGATGTYLRDNSFQMMSVGRDGKPGTGDDIKLR